MLVHDKVFALRACERRTGSRARRGERSARSRAWLQQALTGEQQQYLHTISTLSTAWAGHVCIILEFTQNPDLSLRSGAGWTMDGTEDSRLVG